eukprot:GHRR01014334.1.p1 GENE.GHRR01014334.1~~GHRR01014334.1.p1  ORF type:complete len:214 (+),score=80.23 GHRR01014334.1:223-864(+)
MLRQAGGLLSKLHGSPQQYGVVACVADALQAGFSNIAESINTLAERPDNTFGQDKQVQANSLARTPASALQQRREMSLRYARQIGKENAQYSYRNDVVALHGQLTDYLIKVVPNWIKFAVAGPGQSFNIYQEPTIYTTPDNLLPLCRLAAPAAAMELQCCSSSSSDSDRIAAQLHNPLPIAAVRHQVQCSMHFTCSNHGDPAGSCQANTPLPL